MRRDSKLVSEDDVPDYRITEIRMNTSNGASGDSHGIHYPLI